jgi:peptide-methionine (R)-S-oxide reductase
MRSFRTEVLLETTMLTRRRFAETGFAAVLAAVAAPRLASAADPAKKFEIAKTVDEWRKLLPKEVFYVMREHGTERPFTSPLDKNVAPGVYNCAACDLPLFNAETKYDSGTGWPSFWKPLDDAVGESKDNTLFYTRTQIHCRRCGGHIGHSFPDGPKPTGLRYCMNGVAMKFVPKSTT